jgi:LMBR1 domain-containing protein 1
MSAIISIGEIGSVYNIYNRRFKKEIRVGMQAYLIVLIVVMAIILLAVNIYLLILYIHPDDKGWGTAVYCKILVILGLTLCQAQALMVPLDVANQSNLVEGGLDMRAFWFFLYIIILVFVTVLIPYAIFLYETDE